jgi:hypothetical protein
MIYYPLKEWALLAVLAVLASAIVVGNQARALADYSFNASDYFWGGFLTGAVYGLIGVALLWLVATVVIKTALALCPPR